MFLTSKLITCFINNCTLKLKSQSIACLLSGSACACAHTHTQNFKINKGIDKNMYICREGDLESEVHLV